MTKRLACFTFLLQSNARCWFRRSLRYAYDSADVQKLMHVDVRHSGSKEETSEFAESHSMSAYKRYQRSMILMPLQSSLNFNYPGLQLFFVRDGLSDEGIFLLSREQIFLFWGEFTNASHHWFGVTALPLSSLKKVNASLIKLFNWVSLRFHQFNSSLFSLKKKAMCKLSENLRAF